MYPLHSYLICCSQKAHYEGRLKGYEDDVRRFQRELRSDLYRNAEEKHRQQVIAMKVGHRIARNQLQMRRNLSEANQQLCFDFEQDASGFVFFKKKKKTVGICIVKQIKLQHRNIKAILAILFGTILAFSISVQKYQNTLNISSRSELQRFNH